MLLMSSHILQSPYNQMECSVKGDGLATQRFRVETVANSQCIVYMTNSPAADQNTNTYTVSKKQVLPQRAPASVAQLDAPSDWRPGGRGFNPRRGRQHSFVEIDHEIFSTVILSLPLIQEGQLSVSGERMCTILVNRLED